MNIFTGTQSDYIKLKAFQNGEPKIIFECNRDESMERMERIEQLHNLYSPPNIITRIKSRRMRWAVHVVCMGEIEFLQKLIR